MFGLLALANAAPKNAPVYVPAPKHFHKPPIIIYQGVAPPVHVYEKSSGGYSPVAQAKSGEGAERTIAHPVLGKTDNNRRARRNAPAKPVYKAPPKPPTYGAPKRPTYEAPQKPRYNLPPAPKKTQY